MTMLDKIVEVIETQKERKGTSLPALKKLLDIDAAKNVCFILVFIL